jgi:Bacteriophage probable baseplate hub protein
MAGAVTFPVRAPQWVLTYQGVNITANISQMVTAITYEDRLDGGSGALEVTLEDHEKRWQGSWKPTEGDLVNLLIGYTGEPLLPCGDFQVDELALSGPPDVLHLRCLAAYITPAMRTRNSTGYENQTLGQIASTIATKYGLTMVTASGSSNLKFARVTQRQETDLGFLRRLARAHNYEFTIRGKQVVFYSRASLEATTPVATLARNDLRRFAFRLKTHRVYMAAQVSYQLPESKRLLTQRVMAASDAPTGDTLKLTVRCEDGQQASLRAMSALRGAKMVRTSASFTAPGATVYSAGNTLTITGFGFNDGKYLIESARHRLERATGYTTECEARRVD